MTRLQLRVNKVMLGDQALSGAIADIIPISREQNAQGYKGVVIPVSSSDTKEIEVAPGRYLVRAYMPSGQRLSVQVDALPDQTTAAVLEGRRTSNEWLGWQDLVGQRAGEPSQVSLTQQGGIAFSQTAAVPSPLQLVTAAPGSAVWSTLHQLSKLRSGIPNDQVLHALSPISIQPFAPMFANDQTASLILQPQGLALGSRHYGIVDREGTIDVFCLPVPWNRLDRSYNLREASIDIAIPRNPKEYVGVAVQDENLGTLIGYIATGRLPLANAMMKPGTEAHMQMLNAVYRKVDNPYAAAVGAYLLLQADTASEAEWHDWVNNLSNWFPWLPDGAVLQGALRMKFAATDQDVFEAGQAFLNAWNRGIPVLAPVLRLLLDGVSTLVDDPDADAKTLETVLPSIRSVSRLMVTDQAFTSLRLGERR